LGLQIGDQGSTLLPITLVYLCGSKVLKMR
jgi:hypothetical protein